MSNARILIRRWQAGDEWAAERIYNQYRDTIFSLAYTLLDDPADAEEVAQDALNYALTHIEQYDPQRARFSTWLHTITVSRCRNKRRRRFLPSLSLFIWRQEGGDALDPAPDPERQAMRGAGCDEVREAIQSLSYPIREAILLRHWGDYTYQEMADIMGCSLGTAQSRVRLAHQQLRKIFAQNGVINLEETIQ